MPSITAPKYIEKLKRGPGIDEAIEKPFQNYDSVIHP
jgi:hypothetical protein